MISRMSATADRITRFANSPTSLAFVLEAEQYEIKAAELSAALLVVLSFIAKHGVNPALISAARALSRAVGVQGMSRVANIQDAIRVLRG